MEIKNLLSPPTEAPPNLCHSVKPVRSFCARSIPFRGVPEFREGWILDWKHGLTHFDWSIISQKKHFIIEEKTIILISVIKKSF